MHSLQLAGAVLVLPKSLQQATHALDKGMWMLGTGYAVTRLRFIVTPTCLPIHQDGLEEHQIVKACYKVHSQRIDWLDVMGYHHTKVA